MDGSRAARIKQPLGSNRGVGRKWVAGLATAVLLVACDSSEPEGPRAEPSPSASPTLYYCDDTILDPAVFEAGGLERDDPELRGFVESLDRTTRETVSGWHVVSQDEDGIDAVARIPGGYVSRTVRYSFASVSFELRRGRWVTSSIEECQPQILIEGEGRIIWELAEEPSPSDTELAVMAIEPACSSDRRLTQANTRFVATYSEDSIHLIGTVVPGLIGGNCLDSTPRRLTVRLDEPVGDRALVDAGVYPPERRYPCARRGSRIDHGSLVCSQRAPSE